MPNYTPHQPRESSRRGAYYLFERIARGWLWSPFKNVKIRNFSLGLDKLIENIRQIWYNIDINKIKFHKRLLCILIF